MSRRSGVLVETMGNVDAEPGNTPVEPEPEDLLEGVVDGGLPPVQVGLGGEEVVQVVLLGHRVEVPRALAARIEPVVRGSFTRSRLGPHVPVAVVGVRGAAGLDEPRVLVARVVGHQVEQHAHLPATCFGNQAVQILQAPELRMDAHVIGDVVAPVVVRRGHGRRQPDGVDAQPGEVVEPVDHPAKVATAVPVKVPP